MTGVTWSKSEEQPVFEQPQINMLPVYTDFPLVST